MDRFAAVLLLLSACSPALAQRPLSPEIVPSFYDTEGERDDDLRDAIRLYVKRARNGDGAAAYRVGELYEEGVKRGESWANREEAAKWYNLAIVLGYQPPSPKPRSP